MRTRRAQPCMAPPRLFTQAVSVLRGYSNATVYYAALSRASMFIVHDIVCCNIDDYPSLLSVQESLMDFMEYSICLLRHTWAGLQKIVWVREADGVFAERESHN